MLGARLNCGWGVFELCSVSVWNVSEIGLNCVCAGLNRDVLSGSVCCALGSVPGVLRVCIWDALEGALRVC